jgi:hypothetical protein
MIRFKSAVICADKSGWSCELSNIDEALDISWRGELFTSLMSANFYEFLRSLSTGDIVGIELHLSLPQYDNVLSEIPDFEKLPAEGNFPERWRIWFGEKQPADIQWDQIASNNPFLGPGGKVLLVLQLWHLLDKEYEQLASLDSHLPG